MKLKQISVAIENSPGRLYEVTSSLGEAGINIRALSLVDTGDFGKVRLLVSDVAAARRIMMKKHMPARVDNVVAAELEDKPGSLAKILKILFEANIGVTYMYALVGFSNDKAVMVFRFTDNDRAIEILKENGIDIIGSETFGMLES